MACCITGNTTGQINFISSRQGHDTSTSYHHGNGNTNATISKYTRTNKYQSDPNNFELTKQLTQLTLLTNDDDDTDGTSNMMVMFRVSLECVEFS